MSATGPEPGPGPGTASSAGHGGTNPRKFSEKIALHTQRQAEETAAFQEVMMDITSTRLQAQRLRLARSQGPYYGGSLPNVNQIGRNPQDFQGTFPSALESSRSTRHHGLVERVQRDRRFLSPVRPYRNRQVENALYNSAYLSPPTEPSWRRNCSGSFPADKNQLFHLPSTALNRTNSDSALHTSVMNPPPGDPFSVGGHHALTLRSSRHSGQGDGESRRMFPYPVPPIEENVVDQGKLLKPWNDKKLPLLSSRPKSCEVPGINIFTSLEPPSAPPHGVPLPLNTGGSLPDLSSLHFPSPLPTPLDRDEPGGTAPSLSAAGSTGNLASTLTQLGITSAAAGGGTGGNGTFHQPGLLASLHSTLSNPSLPSSLSNPNIQSSLGSASFSASMSSASMSSASLYSSLSNPSLGSSPSLSSQSLHSSLSNSSLQSASSGNPGYSGSTASPGSSSSTSPLRRAQLTPLILPLGGEARRLHPKQFSPTVSPTLSSITQGVPLDTSRLPLDQRLPPYLFSQAPPLSQHHRLQQQNLRNQHHMQQHFGTQPVGPLGSMKSDGTSDQNIKQEAELQRGVVLQQSNPIVTSDLYNDALLSSLLDEPYLTLQLPAKPCQQFTDHQTDRFSTLSCSIDRNQFPLQGQVPLDLQDPGGPHGQGPLDLQDPVGPHDQGSLDPQDPGGLQLLNNQNQNYSGGEGRHNVPNIILTGDSPPGLSKEIACALSHVPGFQMDPFSLMDPLTLDLLDGDLMLTDPAVEDSFRSDRLQ